MATKKAQQNAVSKKQGGEVKLTLHQLILRNIDRTKKDIADWRIAHQFAEAVANPTRRRLYNLYEDVVLDGHLSGIWKKRVSAVLNKRIMFTRDGVEDESFDVLIKSREFRSFRKKLMQVHSWGIVGIEFIPGVNFAFAEIPRKHIRSEMGLITYDEDGFQGIPYKENPNLWVIRNEDEPFGFLLKASPYALFKKGNWSDWAQFVEIFGQPVIITKYDGHDEQTRVALDNALKDAGSSLRLMLPKQAEFEMMDGKTSNGDGKLQHTFLTALNNELSILVLGNTETTSNDNGGSFAKGQVHADQQMMITKDDMAEEMMLLNDPMFLNALRMYGFNTEGGCFKYEDEIDNAALKAELDIDEKLQKLGVKLSPDYFYEKYHRPKPDDMELEDPGDPEDPEDPEDPAEPKDPEDKGPAMVRKAIARMSFLEKLKAVFSAAP